ncbi:MAG: ABC transporter ATP-binding protein [Candidatus Lokiarchaeota archaeon]|nr:ABC transporter ATP-binding protein [Candidatus Lokiarchaeota archaeon]
MLIKLEQVSKIYGEKETEIRALDGVDLQIDFGEVVTIMGPSGSGKTTLLNVIGAMDSPTSGRVLINNRNIANLPERSLSEYRKNILGYIFQNFYLLPNIDVLGNVLVPLVPYIIREESKQHAISLLKKVGLEGRESSKVSKLSGGESQRVAIARALINNPRIILADEPTGNLDSKTGRNIIDLLLKLSYERKTVIIVTHDPRIAHTVSEHKKGRNIWIKDGKLIQDPDFDIYEWD